MTVRYVFNRYNETDMVPRYVSETCMIGDLVPNEEPRVAMDFQFQTFII